MPALARRLINGETAALARAISVVERDTPQAIEILRAIRPHLGQAIVVGFTGPPGAGKSTLVNAYVAELRRRGKTVGIVAVDPSSPITGGAVLGDRIRMAEHTLDEGVFIRSLASRGALGGELHHMQTRRHCAGSEAIRLDCRVAFGSSQRRSGQASRLSGSPPAWG